MQAEADNQKLEYDRQLQDVREKAGQQVSGIYML
jgi:hypothetical protein